MSIAKAQLSILDISYSGAFHCATWRCLPVSRLVHLPDKTSFINIGGLKLHTCDMLQIWRFNRLVQSSLCTLAKNDETFKLQVISFSGLAFLFTPLLEEYTF